MSSKKLCAYIDFSYQALMNENSEEIDKILVKDINKSLNQCEDEAILYSNSTLNKPTGIWHTPGVNEIDLEGKTWDISTAYAFEKPIRDSFDFSENLAWVCNSELFYKLASTPKNAAMPNEFLIGEDRKMIGYPVYISNILPKSGIILGNFSELFVTKFDTIEINTMSDITLSRKQIVELQIFESLDCLVRRPKSFSKSK